MLLSAQKFSKTNSDYARASTHCVVTDTESLTRLERDVSNDDQRRRQAGGRRSDPTIPLRCALLGGKTPRNVPLREPGFHLAQQHSLSLTPPSAWRKRQASCYRSGHVFSFACNGLPISFFYGNHAQKTFEEVKGEAHCISRGVRFATKEEDRHARENDRLANTGPSPGDGAANSHQRNLGSHRKLRRRMSSRCSPLSPQTPRELRGRTTLSFTAWTASPLTRKPNLVSRRLLFLRQWKVYVLPSFRRRTSTAEDSRSAPIL